MNALNKIDSYIGYRLTLNPIQIPNTILSIHKNYIPLILFGTDNILLRYNCVVLVPIYLMQFANQAMVECWRPL